ncbi:DJ-1 family glyoxalase III [Candidatus Galacturonibacter soehngenii]|uniref:DJ-1/PfpI family protein n=1 Tax=Candidatus Galacturonatibacter soehngenii TaxID=2307010 RepID=A0A7V7QNX2_9FIRM|nr:DJ-1 family glyoxalase III [Candidatus Galacturonibacter soehngenii]KAB1440975.1 DJ-1/PfpI family protein [Candidatus Galacturonibacter soehngenii]MBA4688751.1 DJ-1/PfpI family protein [Candidatus Galacturonibacter soehngenii]
MSKVGIFLADGFEEIEGLTVVDLLRRAEIEIDMISITKKREVTGAHQIVVLADKLFEEVSFETYDMLVLPGGMPGTKNLGACEGLVTLLKQFAKEKKNISAICAAPSVLGDNEILKGKHAICYPGFEERLKGAVIEEKNVVVDENIITSKGMGTAIDFGLAIIEKLVNQKTALKLKAAICYKSE